MCTHTSSHSACTGNGQRASYTVFCLDGISGIEPPLLGAQGPGAPGDPGESPESCGKILKKCGKPGNVEKSVENFRYKIVTIPALTPQH